MAAVLEGTELRIEPLSSENLKQAIELLSIVFPPPDDPTTEELLACLNHEGFSVFFDLEYWVILDDDDVIGITGIQSDISDYKEAVWIGWTAIHPKYRGKKAGRLLYDLTIAKAKETGKRYLRVYTSDYPDEIVANKIYVKRGFKLIKVEYRPDWECNKLIYQLEL
ncbi:Acetyltransferase (GNAT) family protein [uncultured archaeon]|nr:Acetyltransferase (GNAT) family protein [uncultured archaeon]